MSGRPHPGPIRQVSDTAHWVAFYRARETERRDALFRDPWARRLAGERGAAIVGSLPRGHDASWALVVRTCLFDEMIRRAVEAGGVDLVLNLAAGLDTRAWRLGLPSSLRWLDVDLPHVLEYKAKIMEGERPSCAYQAVAADLTVDHEREALFDRAAAAGKLGLVVSEGLLVYLHPDQVMELARSLHRREVFRWWMLDLVSPGLLRRLAETWGRRLADGNAPFRFGPAEGGRFFAPAGWKEVVYRSMWDEAKRLKREMPMAWFWRMVAGLAPPERRVQFSRMSGVVLLERT